MIAGWFDALDRPRVRARLIIPRLGVNGRVNFLVDTGATITTLHPDDGRRVNCPFDELRTPRNMAGVGGSNRYFQEPAVVVLYDRAGTHTFDIELLVSKPHPPSAANPHPVVSRPPSLLGRDVLNRMRTDYDFPAGRLNFLS